MISFTGVGTCLPNMAKLQAGYQLQLIFNVSEYQSKCDSVNNEMDRNGTERS